MYYCRDLPRSLTGSAHDSRLHSARHLRPRIADLPLTFCPSRNNGDNRLALAELLEAHLKRVERDARGIPIKLFLFTRKPTADDTSTPVEVDPTLAFGRPVLRARGVAVAKEEVEEAIRVEFYNRDAA